MKWDSDYCLGHATFCNLMVTVIVALLGVGAALGLVHMGMHYVSQTVQQGPIVGLGEAIRGAFHW